MASSFQRKNVSIMNQRLTMKICMIFLATACFAILCRDDIFSSAVNTAGVRRWLKTFILVRIGSVLISLWKPKCSDNAFFLCLSNYIVKTRTCSRWFFFFWLFGDEVCSFLSWKPIEDCCYSRKRCHFSIWSRKLWHDHTDAVHWQCPPNEPCNSLFAWDVKSSSSSIHHLRKNYYYTIKIHQWSIDRWQ